MTKYDKTIFNALDTLDERLIDQAMDYTPGRMDMLIRHRAAIAAAFLLVAAGSAALAISLQPQKSMKDHDLRDPLTASIKTETPGDTTELPKPSPTPAAKSTADPAAAIAPPNIAAPAATDAPVPKQPRSNIPQSYTREQVLAYLDDPGNRFNLDGSSSPNTAVWHDWEDLPVYEKYPYINANGSTYVSIYSYVHNNAYESSDLYLPLDPSAIGEQVFTGFAQDITDKEAAEADVDIRSAGCQLWEINGVSPDCALAVRYDGYEEYFTCWNLNYSPADLGQLFRDIGFPDEAVLRNAHIYQVWYDGSNQYSFSGAYECPDMATLSGLLFTDLSVPALPDADDTYDYSEGISDVSFSADLNRLGLVNCYFRMSAKDGTLSVSFTGGSSYWCRRFFLGAEKVQALADHIKTNCYGVCKETADPIVTGGESGGSYSYDPDTGSLPPASTDQTAPIEDPPANEGNSSATVSHTAHIP